MRNHLGFCLLLCSITAFATPPQTLSTETSATAEASSTPGDSWMSQAQQDLAKREYQFSSNETGLQAPNRAQGFRSYVDSYGVSLVSREADNEPLAGLQLTTIGRSGSVQTLGAAEVLTDGSQTQLQWQGVSTQYDNGPAGLSMSTTLAQCPAGEGNLNLEFTASNARPQANNDGVLLINASNDLQIGAIKALDANNNLLPLTLIAQDSVIRVEIDDSSAIFPIKLQSVITATNDGLLEQNQAGAKFGPSIAGAGDVNGDGYDDVIVGAPHYADGEQREGAAFIYFGSAGSFDTTADALFGPTNQEHANMGYSVAGVGDLNGDGFADVIVGAANYDNDEVDEGAVFIYFGADSTPPPTPLIFKDSFE